MSKVFRATVTDKARQKAALLRKELNFGPSDNIFVRDPRKIKESYRGPDREYLYRDNAGDVWKIEKIDDVGYSTHGKWIFVLFEDSENDTAGRRTEMSVHEVSKSKKDALRSLAKYLKERTYSTEFGWVSLDLRKEGINVVSL